VSRDDANVGGNRELGIGEAGRRFSDLAIGDLVIETTRTERESAIGDREAGENKSGDFAIGGF
jgi:hypothetical protein